MQLHEIYHKHEDQTFAEYLETLLKSNVARIASGKFATVIIPHKSNYVYKVWVNDPGYERWMDFCKKNNNNPIYGSLLPRFVKNTSIIDIPFSRNTRFRNTKLKVQRIEKLESAKDYDSFGGSIEIRKRGVDSYSDLISHIAYYAASISKQDIEDIIFDEDIENHEELHSTITKLWYLFSENDLSSFGGLDVHDGNFMFRGNDIVLTDIFSNNVDPAILVGHVSWDGRNIKQGKHAHESDFDDDGEKESDQIAAFIPNGVSRNSNQFIKGRVSSKINFEKLSTPPQVLNFLRFHKINELLEDDEFMEELYGNEELIVALEKYIVADDKTFYMQLLSMNITNVPKELINKYEEDIIKYIVDNEDENAVESYIEQYGSWTKLEKEADDHNWDISHLI